MASHLSKASTAHRRKVSNTVALLRASSTAAVHQWVALVRETSKATSVS